VTAADAGLPTHPGSAILGGDAEHNAAAMRRLFDGEAGAYHDIVCLNAAAGLMVAGSVASLKAGAEAAAAVIADGRARTTLSKLVQQSQAT
jgi:anthranilate phosphoribosyltransferase